VVGPVTPGGDATTCPFCAIARGEDSSAEILGEGERWLAFFPRDPVTPGHTLIIPRDHVADLWALEPDEAKDLMAAVVRVGRAINAAIEPEGMNLITSAGEAAEQTIFHLHLHVVPRWRRDGFKIWPPERPLAEELKEDAAERIRSWLRPWADGQSPAADKDCG
jgi:histidine triad (HIT) family protein